MKKRKMNADSVDQLFEIVKAVQQGQDPEEMLRKKQAESAPMADSPNSNPAENTESDNRGTMSEGAGVRNSDHREIQEDEFLTLLNDESQNSFDISAWKEKVHRGIVTLFELLQPKRDAANTRKTKQKYVPSEGTHSEKMKEQEAKPEIVKKQEEKPETAKNQEEKSETAKEQEAKTEFEKTEDERTIERLLELTKEQTQESEEIQNKSSTEAAKKQETVLIQGIDLEEDAIRGRSDKEQEASVEKKISEQREAESVEEQEEAEENAKQKMFRKKQGQNEKIQLSDIPKNVQQMISGWRNKLFDKGFGEKEGILLLLVLVFVIIIVMLISNAIRISGENKKKREHVTADSGLTVLVEQEPEQWCRSGFVTLKVRAKGSRVLKVVLDDVSYEPDEDGMITVQAENYLLQLSVETENETLNAQVEIPRIDTQRPVVTAERIQDQIVLSAVDGRSGISKVMYAVIKEGDYVTLPYYQEYTQPFAYEQGAMYYFYAEDFAGNRSLPVKTTMETAQEILLTEETLCLFPEETRQLCVITEPEAAYLSNLTFESMNPSVAVVDGTGLVTAVSEGATAVRVKADGLSEVMCAVEVSSSRTVTISALGDCTLGTDAYFNTSVNFQAYEAMYGASYFFQDVKTILENDDATFANLEGVFTESTARENKQYAFKGDPDYTQILLDGSVEIVTLANNHSSDYGEQSKKDTKQYLTEAGIDYCEGDTIAIQKLNGIKAAFIGIYVLHEGMAREEQVRSTIAEAKTQGAQLVIVAFHWGSEKSTQPDETQTALAHIAVEEGADLVVGHHPHVLQGIEKYNGKYIVYSLGNFCFGGNTNPSDTDTMIFRQTFTITEAGVQEDDQIEIIPCSVSGASGYNDYQPTPVTGTEADRIMGRINEYSAPYGQTYTASTGFE